MGNWHWPTFLMLFAALFWGFAVLCYADKQLNNKQYPIALFWALLPTFLILACRADTVGIDLVRYARHIELAEAGKIVVTGFLSEPLMQWVYRLSAWLPGPGLRNFIVITTVINYVFIYMSLVLLKRHDLPTDAVFVLFWSFIMIRSTSMVSNSLAVSCSLVAYILLLKKSPKVCVMYWLLTAIAIGFHNSALINVPVFFVCQSFHEKKSVRKKQEFFVVAMFVCYIVCYVLLAAGVADVLLQKIAGGQYASNMNIKFSFGIGNTAVRAPLIFLCLVLWPRLIKKYGYRVTPVLLLIVFDLYISQLKYLSQSFERFTMYTGLGTVIVVPLLIEACIDAIPDRQVLQLPYTQKQISAKQIIRRGYWIFLGAFFVYYLYRWSVEGNYGIMPFQFWVYE